MPRPQDLADYGAPPLDEVVMGIQFARPQPYHQLLAGEVWKLYRDKFPHIEEHQALEPTFELFGAPQMPTFRFGLRQGASHDRFWFVNDSKEQLIQFQHDRLLHNWRKVDGGENVYPRFENMIVDFENEIRKLDGFCEGISAQKLNINQCELTYINHISPVGDMTLHPSNWLKTLQFPVEAEDFNSVFRLPMTREGNPFGRITFDASSGIHPSKGQIDIVTITARGTPRTNDLSGALEFLKDARERIVKLFTDCTTEKAHALWERKA